MGHIELGRPGEPHLVFQRASPSRMGHHFEHLPPVRWSSVLYFASYMSCWIPAHVTGLEKYKLVFTDNRISAEEAAGRGNVRRWDIPGGHGRREPFEEMLMNLNLDELAGLKTELDKLSAKDSQAGYRTARSASASSSAWRWWKPSANQRQQARVDDPGRGARHSRRNCAPWCSWTAAVLPPADLNDLYRRVINRNNRLKRHAGTRARRTSSCAMKSACCRRPWTP